MRFRLSLRPFSCAFSGLFIFCSTAALLPAQNAGAPDSVIRSETRLVLVDAVAVDKKGGFARDLTQKDFRIWEDGREQKITSFSLESAAASPERPQKHYIALFFDTSSLAQAGQMAARREAVAFVERFASPDRYMAVVNYNYNGGVQIAQNFTTDAERLKAALTEGRGSAISTPNSAAPAASGRGARGGGGSITGPATYMNMLAALRSVADSLSSVRGRKALVLFSGGMSIANDVSAEVTNAVSAFNRANVAVYTFGPGVALAATGGPFDAELGQQQGGRPSRTSRNSDAFATAQSVPPPLAESTGGVTFPSTNDLAVSLGRIAQEQDEYYLLGYTPAVESAEGTCHNLRVRVERSHLEVRARKSYCTSRPLEALSGKPAPRDLEAMAAGGTAPSMKAAMQLPWFYTGPNVARVSIAMDIDPSEIRFRKEKGKLRGEIDLAGIAYDPDGSVAARFSDTAKLDFDTQQQADAFLQQPYRYANQFDIAPGRYNFRMVFSAGDRGFGRLETPLTIEPWNGQALSMSGLALGRDAHPVADLAAGLDGSLLEGPHALVSRGIEVVPTGTTRFRAGERAVFYFEVYAPEPQPNALVRVRILDRATGQPKNDSGAMSVANYIRPGNPLIPVVMALPTAGLPAGTYKAEVSVLRENGQNAVLRTADFDVE